MWKHLAPYFDAYPIRMKIAQKMLEYGLRTSNGKIYCGPIELSDSKLARAFDVDRRAIAATIATIQAHPELLTIFDKLQPTSNLRDVASAMNWGVIEILPDDPSTPGILAEVATLIAQEQISIRQAISDDFELTEEPRLYVITEGPIPAHLIPKIRHAKGVKGVLIY